ncbi:MAG: alcohol acetyltransferase [Carnobacterium sp.]|nr:alcohol acetyltransferase [Carnobacterium sp.]
MKRKTWVRLDNASNIFLAAMTNRDTKVFRLTAEMTSIVDPKLLQKALDKTYEQYLLYHSVLRRGVFWYYLVMSDLKPKVVAETLPPCSPLYHFDQKELLFRVIYQENRIHLEVFHVLSDGIGAMWFFEDLIKEYVYLRVHEIAENKWEKTPLQIEQQLEDSFNQHFRQEGQNTFSNAARSAFFSVVKTSKQAGKVVVKYSKKTSSWFGSSASIESNKKRVYQIKNKKTPDNRPRVVDLSVPLKETLQLAKEQQVSLTIYLIALFFESIRKAETNFKQTDTIAISVPVNLRQFYQSNSARNFFSTVLLEYTYSGEEEEFNHLCMSLSKQLHDHLEPERLSQRLSKLIKAEYHPIARISLRPFKDMILKLINRQNNRKVTVAMSNLGQFALPYPMNTYIKQVYFKTSAVRPQFCMISYEDSLTISFTSPFIDVAIQKEFSRFLSEAGLPVSIAVNQVTTAELGGESG